MMHCIFLSYCSADSLPQHPFQSTWLTIEDEDRFFHKGMHCARAKREFDSS